jgi:hypothetical protein
LFSQIVERSIRAVIVHEKEMADTHFTVIIKEIGQAYRLVPLGAEQQQIV